jgi:hypothetical protein
VNKGPISRLYDFMPYPPTEYRLKKTSKKTKFNSFGEICCNVGQEPVARHTDSSEEWRDTKGNWGVKQPMLQVNHVAKIVAYLIVRVLILF